MGCSVSSSSYRDPVVAPAAANVRPEEKKKHLHGGQCSAVDLHQKNQDFGSKEEFFFDSRAWLESDCEDDFYSVNGEFTPNYQVTAASSPRLNKTFDLESLQICNSEYSPTGRKKLAILFQETRQSEKHSSDPNVVEKEAESAGKRDDCYLRGSDGSPKSTPGFDYGTPEKEQKSLKESPEVGMTCCLPSLS